jgi:hypothetical protein
MDSYYKEYNNKKSNGSEEVAVLERDEELDTDYKEEGAVYPMTYIKVDKGFFSVYELKRKYDTHVKIILDRSFQREGVWSINKKIELIESVLMGLPLPIFYFNQDKHGNLIVIDGRQRLEALFQYIDNKFPLNGLKILPEYNAKRFRDLDPVIQ